MFFFLTNSYGGNLVEVMQTSKGSTFGNRNRTMLTLLGGFSHSVSPEGKLFRCGKM